MARAPPSAPSIPFRKRSTFSRPGRLRRSRTSPEPDVRSGGLDVFAQRFLFALEFADPPFDDVADRDQADYHALLDHRQMPEFAQRHHFHDRGDSVGLPATDHLGGHDLADRFIEHPRTAFTQRADDIALRQDAFDAALAHHQHGADLAFPQKLDRSRKRYIRLDALDVMAFGIEDCTYRHLSSP